LGGSHAGRDKSHFQQDGSKQVLLQQVAQWLSPLDSKAALQGLPRLEHGLSQV